MPNPLTNFRGNNTGSLRIALFYGRRDRIISLAWLIGLMSLIAAVSFEMHSIYGDPATLHAMLPMLQNPAMLAMVGPVFDPNNYTSATMIAGMMLLMTATAVAFMNIFFIVRYTRADEEQERAEIIRALPVGRLAPLNAALLAAFVLNIFVVLANWAGILMVNVPGMNSTGAFLYGAAIGAVGMVFAGVAAICSQLASTSRGALAYSSIVVGLMYLLRAAGDVLRVDHSWGESLSLASPLGLSLRVEAFGANNFWPLPWLLLTAVVLVAIAYFLNARRDLGAGIVPQKPGPAHAGIFLRSNLGLSFALLRNTLIGWAIGAVLLGASYGSIMNQITAFIQTSPFFTAALTNDLGYTMAESFASMILVVLAGMLAAVPIMVVLRARREEEEGRAEIVLSTPTSRTKFFSGYASIAFVSSIVMLLLSALGLWGAAVAVMTSDPISAQFVFKGILIYLPAVWIHLAVAMLLIAVLPRFAGAISWVYLGMSFFLGYFGQLFPQIPTWLQNMSTFGLIPNITQAAVPWDTLGIMTAIAFATMVLSFVLYRKRDLSS